MRVISAAVGGTLELLTGVARAGVLVMLLPLVFVLLRADSGAADTLLAGGLPQAPKVSAAGQALAWSAFDPAVSAWRLMVRRDGITRALAIAPSPTPFDVDLGDDGHGGLVATYSRCSQPSRAPALPHGCRLFAYDFTTGGERPIAVANLTGASQFLPSMAAGRVAFVRINDSRAVGKGNEPRIYIQKLAGGQPRPLPGGTQNGDPRTGPTALDLSATTLAFTWDAPGFVPPYYAYGISELSVDGLSGDQTLVELREGTGELSPTLVRGGVDYGDAGAGVAVAGEPYDQFRSFGLPSARRDLAAAPEGLASTATGAAGTVYSRCASPMGQGTSSSRSCEVDLAPSVAYLDPDRQVAHASRPTTLSAFRGNWLAFSAYDSTSGTYHLMVRAPSGSVAAAPVPPRRVPFDVELGPLIGDGEESQRGGVVAVYSRCRVEPRLDLRDLLPLPWTGRGCRLFRYDLGSPRERLIPGSGSRYLPSVWGSRLAFAMSGPGGRPALYLGSIDGRTAPRLLPGGPTGTSGMGPRALTLYNRDVAFVWEYRLGASLRSQLWLDGSGRQVLLDATSSPNGTDRELSPSFTTAGHLAWARRDAGGRSWMFVLLRSKRHVVKCLVPDPIQALSVVQLSDELPVQGTILYARGDDRGGATIRRMAGPPASASQP